MLNRHPGHIRRRGRKLLFPRRLAGHVRLMKLAAPGGALLSGQSPLSPFEAASRPQPVLCQILKIGFRRSPAKHCHDKVILAEAISMLAQNLAHAAAQLVAQMGLADLLCTNNTEFGGFQRRILQNTQYKKPTRGRDSLLSHPGEFIRTGHAL